MCLPTHPPLPGAIPTFLTPSRPLPGRPRPTCQSFSSVSWKLWECIETEGGNLLFIYREIYREIRRSLIGPPQTSLNNEEARTTLPIPPNICVFAHSVHTLLNSTFGTRFVGKPEEGSSNVFLTYVDYFSGVILNMGDSLQTWGRVERHQRGGGGVNPSPDKSSTAKLKLHQPVAGGPLGPTSILGPSDPSPPLFSCIL